MFKAVVVLLSLSLLTASFGGEKEDACKAYVSILDGCDVSTDNCEQVGKTVKETLLKKGVDEKMAEHMYNQCVKVCSLPDGSYEKIREDIEKACMESMEE